MMYGLRSQFVLSLWAGCFCLLAACPASATQSHKAHKTPAVQEAPPPDPAPEAPPIPLTLQEMPATAPQVSYDHGQLTIISQNSTLGDILRAVRDRTGAVLDLPGNPSERVAGQMGPGSARDVLAELLGGSHFNYVILGSATDASKVAKVILTTKPAVSADSPPANNAAPPPQPAGGQYGFNQAAASDDDDDAADTSDQQPNQAPTQAPVRTPEQLLEELQRQQQQSQQQQGQAQPGQTPAPRDRN